MRMEISATVTAFGEWIFGQEWNRLSGSKSC